MVSSMAKVKTLGGTCVNDMGSWRHFCWKARGSREALGLSFKRGGDGVGAGAADRPKPRRSSKSKLDCVVVADAAGPEIASSCICEDILELSYGAVYAEPLLLESPLLSSFSSVLRSRSLSFASNC